MDLCNFKFITEDAIIRRRYWIDEIVKLRTKELEFLLLLIKNKNRYVSYEEIENYVWSDSVMTKDALKTLVKNIKIKISKDLILNLTNSGYKIDV